MDKREKYHFFCDRQINFAILEMYGSFLIGNLNPCPSDFRSGSCADPQQPDRSKSQPERHRNAALRRGREAEPDGAVVQKQPDCGGGLRFARSALWPGSSWRLLGLPPTRSFLLTGVILSNNNRTLTIQRVKREDSGRYTCTACNRRGCDSSQAFLTTEGQFK